VIFPEEGTPGFKERESGGDEIGTTRREVRGIWGTFF